MASLDFRALLLGKSATSVQARTHRGHTAKAKVVGPMVAQQEQLERPHPQPAQDAAPQQQQEPQPGGTPLQLPVRAEVAGFTITAMRRNLEADEANDFFDFDADNPVAVSTGTLLWDASWLIISLLQEDEAQTSGGTPVLPSGLGLRAAIRGRRVLELGSGIGLAGLCCAASGAHVLLSDLPSVVHGILKQNCDANCSSSSSSSSSGAPARPTGSSAPWPGARVCGHGSVGLAPVDFCLPLADQVRERESAVGAVAPTIGPRPQRRRALL